MNSNFDLVQVDHCNVLFNNYVGQGFKTLEPAFHFT